MFLGNNPTQDSDLDLIERFRSKSDQNALGELFTRYSAMVYGVCLKYLKDREVAKDAVMAVFEKLQSELKKHELAHFKSWLFVTTKNHCLMHLRAGKKMILKELNESVVENEFILHHSEDNGLEQNLEKLTKCIEQLKNDQKLCVQLFYLKEVCYKEIVKTTGIELKKVKSHIQNGKRNLKICLEQHG